MIMLNKIWSALTSEISFGRSKAVPADPLSQAEQEDRTLAREIDKRTEINLHLQAIFNILYQECDPSQVENLALIEETIRKLTEASLQELANNKELERISAVTKAEKRVIAEAEIATNLIEKAFVRLEKVTLEGEAKLEEAKKKLNEAKEKANFAKLSMERKRDEIRARRRALNNRSVEIKKE